MNFILKLIILISIISCASNKEKGIRLYNAKAFSQAREYLSEHLKSNHDDIEAIEYLKKSEDEAINELLVKLNSYISSSKIDLALDSALEIDEMFKKWGYAPDYNLSKYHSNEMTKLINKFEKYSVDEKYPLKLHALMKKYKVLFEKSFPEKIKFTENLINKKGLSVCNNLSQNKFKSDVIKSSFAIEFCALFNSHNRAIASVNLDNLFYSKVELNLQIKGVSKELQNEIENTLNDKIKKTVYYNASSTSKLKVNLTGIFNIRNYQSLESMTHEYSVDIPYTAYEARMNSRQVPYQATQYQCDVVYSGLQSAQVCGNVPVTRYRTEFYTENVPVTRYRKEPRSHAYNATKHTQDYLFTVKAIAKDNNIDFSTTSSSQKKNISYSHEEDLPSIGLVRQENKNPSEVEIIKNNIDALLISFEESLNNLWHEKYCKLNLNKNRGEILESDLRCLRSKKAELAFLNKISNQIFGIEFENAKEYFKSIN